MNDRGAGGRDNDRWLRAALCEARRRARSVDSSGLPVGNAACPDAEMLAAYVEHALDPEERHAIEQHAATCDRCLDALSLIATSLDASPEVVVEASTGTAWWRRWSTWLVPATAAATALGLYLAVRPPGAPPFEGARQAEEASQAEQATGPPAEVARPEREGDKREKDALALAPEAGAGPASAPAMHAPLARPGPAKSQAKGGPNRYEAAPQVAQDVQAPQTQVTAPAKPAEELPRAPAQADEALVARRDAESKKGTGTGTGAVPAAPPAAVPKAALGEVASNEARQPEAKSSRAPGVVEAWSPSRLLAWRFEPGVAVSFSRDGGATWQPAQVDRAGFATRAMQGAARVPREVDRTPPRVLAASAPSDAACWAVGTGGLVMVTTDAVTWTMLPFPDTSDLVAVSASDGRTAVVTFRDGRRYDTHDGGASWQRVP